MKPSFKSLNTSSKSWRNHQRIAFIKGFYKARQDVMQLCRHYENNHVLDHDAIDSVLENHLRELKDLSHTLYRVESPESKEMEQRLFDKVIGEVWHEMGKARDNMRLLEAYTTQVSGINQKFARSISYLEKQVIASARRDLPGQMKRSHRMMEKLVSLFELILPLYRDNDIIFRTLYFSQNTLDPFCEPNAVEYFFRTIFGSVAEGYVQLIRSLLNTKHILAAQDVLEEFREWEHENQKGNRCLKIAERELNASLHHSHPKRRKDSTPTPS